MKPLWLSLEGLQSYRQRQFVDFSQMDQCGLFGIFGPTGSGKSSILDAMTLALFGSVNRASHNTQGIINSECERAAVSLAFQLSLADGRKTYRIDRVYRRKNKSPDSCEIRLSRLVQLDGAAETVLADKPGEINAAVGKLLGLQYDDFIRAVVLPQNQFQEFLLMAKKEKSDMLERLFGLTEYGQDLARKVSRGRRLAEDSMRQAEGALGVLNEYTEESVQSLRLAFAASSAAKEQAAAGYQELSRQAEVTRELYQVSCRKNELLRKQTELEALTAGMERDRERLKAARAAEPLWPVFEETRKLAEQKAELVLASGQVSVSQASVAGQLEAAALEIDFWQKEGSGRRDQLGQSIRLLEKAAGLAEQLGQLEARLAGEEKKRQEWLEQKLISTAAAAEVKPAWEVRQADLAALRHLRQELAADPVWRQELEAWSSCILNIKEKEQSRQAETDRQIDLESQILLVSQRLEASRADYTAEQARVLQEAATRLRDGQPCPVCGSTGHPAPYHVSIEETRQPGRRRADDESMVVRLEERLAASRKEMEKLDENLDTLRRARNEQLARFPAMQNLDDPEQAQQALQTVYRQEKERADAEQQIQATEEIFRNLSGRLQAAADQILHIDGLLAGQEPLLRELAGQVDLGRHELADFLPGRAADHIKPEPLRRELTELSQLYAELDQKYTRLTEKRQALLDEKTALAYRLVENNAHITSIGRQLDQLGGQLAAALPAAGFDRPEALAAARLTGTEIQALADRLLHEDEDRRDLVLQLRQCDDVLKGRSLAEDEWQSWQESLRASGETLEQAVRAADIFRQRLGDAEEKLAVRKEKEAAGEEAAALRDRIGQIESLIRGNAFVEYVAEERLQAIVAEATVYLGTMTRYRYALELDSDASFAVRDMQAGGQIRQASSLSGGETFIASLALALALSSQIQLRGQSRLEFFFLDEGFGSLDPETLDLVMDSLERISSPRQLIGVISHVPELRQRISTRLVVTPPSGIKGSQIRLERD